MLTFARFWNIFFKSLINPWCPEPVLSYSVVEISERRLLFNYFCYATASTNNETSNERKPFERSDDIVWYGIPAPVSVEPRPGTSSFGRRRFQNNNNNVDDSASKSFDGENRRVTSSRPSTGRAEDSSSNSTLMSKRLKSFKVQASQLRKEVDQLKEVSVNLKRQKNKKKSGKLFWFAGHIKWKRCHEGWGARFESVEGSDIKSKCRWP